MWDNERDLEKGLMDEGTLRNIMNKNSVDEILLAYNTYIKGYVFPQLGFTPNIHVVDCTEIEVPLDNSNYEASGVVKDKDGVRRGYKLSTLERHSRRYRNYRRCLFWCD